MNRIDSTFGTHGPFYAMRRSLWTPLPPDTLLDNVYLPLSAFFKGYRVVLEPTSTIYDFPTALKSEFRRKVRLQAGLYQLLHLMPELLTSRNRMRVHFLSGKFGRLVIPYCMIAIAISTIGLPPHWRGLAVAAQLLFYGAAAIDPIVKASFPIKRITSTIRTFVVLMAAQPRRNQSFLRGSAEVGKKQDSGYNGQSLSLTRHISSDLPPILSPGIMRLSPVFVGRAWSGVAGMGAWGEGRAFEVPCPTPVLSKLFTSAANSSGVL